MRYYTIIGLLTGLTLYGTNVRAQRDDYVLRVVFSGPLHSFDVPTEAFDSGVFVGHGSRYAAVQAYLDTSVVVAFSTVLAFGSQGGLYERGVRFVIDSNGDQIRALQITDAKPWGGFGYWSYRATCDSVPFVRNGQDLLISNTSIVCSYNWLAVYLNSGVPYQESGETTGQGTETDTITLSLTKRMSSASASSEVISRTFAFTRIARDEFELAFPLSFKERILTIEDALGRCIRVIDVAALSTSLELDRMLPPGCYFARLGSEVAKFVVPW